MAQKWVVDPTHTNVEFPVKHMMIATVRGRFSEVEGVIEGDPSDLTTARFEATINTKSIDTRQEDRDNHLRSADFFDVENHPKITFKSTSVEKVGENQYKVTGDLTIRGVTRPVNAGHHVRRARQGSVGRRAHRSTAKGAINRKDFGLTWNAALETGGVLVSDEVKLEIDAEAVRQAGSVSKTGSTAGAARAARARLSRRRRSFPDPLSPASLISRSAARFLPGVVPGDGAFSCLSMAWESSAREEQQLVAGKEDCVAFGHHRLGAAPLDGEDRGAPLFLQAALGQPAPGQGRALFHGGRDHHAPFADVEHLVERAHLQRQVVGGALERTVGPGKEKPASPRR